MTRREQLNRMRLGTLHAEFIPIAEQFIERLEQAAYKPLIVQARRTFAEQDGLYARGRTAPGLIVTWVRAGHSFHGYGLAMDILDIGASGDPDAYDQSDWEATPYGQWQVFMSSELRWGGLWHHADRPHYEYAAKAFEPWQAALLMPYADADGFLPPHFFRDRGSTV